MKTLPLPSKLVNRYIAVEAALAPLLEEEEQLKLELRALYAKGYRSDKLNFKEGTQFAPKWKMLVDELLLKYMTPGQRRIYKAKLLKRFPPQPKAPTIEVISKSEKVAA